MTSSAKRRDKVSHRVRRRSAAGPKVELRESGRLEEAVQPARARMVEMPERKVEEVEEGDVDVDVDVEGVEAGR
jgi:hypothetical protein